MARSVKITLDGQEYLIHALNIGQLERLTDAFDKPAGRTAYAVLRIAMERAEPKIDVDLVAPSVDEVRNAFQAIAELSGFLVKGETGEATPNPTLRAVIN